MIQKKDIELDETFPLPKIYITLEAFQKIFGFARSCPVEVNGFGIVKRVGNAFIITDSFILSQKATATSTETDEEALHKFLYKIVCAGFSPSDITLQWHSHVNMDTYCSGTDIATVARYQNDFMISLVVNKLGSYHCRLDIYKPVRIGFTTALNIIVPISEKMMANCKEEIEKKVKITQHPAFGDGMISRIAAKIATPENETYSNIPLTVPAENIKGGI